MWYWVMVVGGWLLFGFLVFGWVRWAEKERELFANGNSRHLE
jgi:hypothetical protein